MSLEDVKLVSTADVYKNETFAGKISRTIHGSVFEYDDAYLRNADPGGGIACNLPHSEKEYETSGVNLHTYFAGLLPEGMRLRALTRKIKTSEDDLLSLLIATGADCVGDVSVVAEGHVFRPAGTPTIAVRKLKKALFPELFEKSIAYEVVEPQVLESTIPGIQQKISAAVISFPVKTKSTHASYILKLNPPDKPRLVENEEFFLGMAKACGIAIPAARLVRDRDGNAGLLVNRFDRVFSPDTRKVSKIHQEDACQFLDRYPADKYNVKCSEIAEGFQRWCSSPPVEVAKFLRLLAFSYLIGNGDLHAKNVSIQTLAETRAVVMTPAYDLLSTLPYGDQRMALQFEGRNDNFRRRYFAEFGERFGLPKAITASILEELCAKSLPWIGRLEEIGLDEKRTRHLRTVMTKRRRDLG